MIVELPTGTSNDCPSHTSPKSSIQLVSFSLQARYCFDILMLLIFVLLGRGNDSKLWFLHLLVKPLKAYGLHWRSCLWLCFDPCSSSLSFRTMRPEIDRIGLFAQSSDSLAAESQRDDQLDSTDHRAQPIGNSTSSGERSDESDPMGRRESRSRFARWACCTSCVFSFWKQ